MVTVEGVTLPSAPIVIVAVNPGGVVVGGVVVVGVVVGGVGVVGVLELLPPHAAADTATTANMPTAIQIDGFMVALLKKLA